MLVENLLQIKDEIEAENAAQLAAVEAVGFVFEVDVRCDLLDEFWLQVNEKPGRFCVAPGRVWRARDLKFRNFLIGSSGDSSFLGQLAARLRWHCRPDGEVGHGFFIMVSMLAMTPVLASRYLPPEPPSTG